MFTIENTVVVKSSIKHVWAVLTALEDFRLWHPYVSINGQAIPDGLISYGLQQLAGLPGRRSIPARIHTLELGRAIGWRLSIPRLLMIYESYSLSTSGSRTVVRHLARFEGPISGLVRKSVIRRVKPLLDKADAALAKKLDGSRRQTSAAGRLSLR